MGDMRSETLKELKEINFMFYTIPAMILYLGFQQLINKGGTLS